MRDSSRSQHAYKTSSSTCRIPIRLMARWISNILITQPLKMQTSEKRLSRSPNSSNTRAALQSSWSTSTRTKGSWPVSSLSKQSICPLRKCKSRQSRRSYWRSSRYQVIAWIIIRASLSYIIAATWAPVSSTNPLWSMAPQLFNKWARTRWTKHRIWRHSARRFLPELFRRAPRKPSRYGLINKWSIDYLSIPTMLICYTFRIYT